MEKETTVRAEDMLAKLNQGILVGLLVFFAMGLVPSLASAKPPVESKGERKKALQEDEGEEVNAELWEAVWNGQIKAGSHVRYHQGYAKFYGWCASTTRVAGLLFSIIGFAVPLALTAKQKKSKVILNVLAVVALVVALFPSVLPMQSNRQKHGDAHGAWRQLMLDWSLLKDEAADLSTAELRSRVAVLKSQESLIERSIEPLGYDEEYLGKCELKEAEVRVADHAEEGSGTNVKNSSVAMAARPAETAM